VDFVHGRDASARVIREIGGRVRAVREAAGLTQEEAAARSGIDYKRWQRIETGGVNVTIRTLIRIAVACRTDFWSLMGKRR
jgi:transcriptional regulator with XRE-family HTH domain